MSVAEGGLAPLEVLRGMRRWNVSAGLAAVWQAVVFGTLSTGYALALGATNSIVGLLSGAQSWGHLLQLVSPLLSGRVSRRKPLCALTFALGYSMWLLVALLPWVLPRAWQPWAMIALVIVSGALVALTAPMANTWLTDLVPAEVRGRWVARNQSIMAAVGLLAALAGGRFIDHLPHAYKVPGFQLLFVVAVGFALASVYVWTKVPEPPMRASTRPNDLRLLALPFRDVNFRNYTLFIAVRTASVMIAAPFFAVHMLKTLDISYQKIALFGMAVTFTQIASNPLWGYLADKYGYKPLLRIATFGQALIPLPWFFTTKDNCLPIILAVQLWAGVIAAGVILSQYNLMLKSAPAENREVYIGVHAAVVNAAVVLGSMCGGFLADLLSKLGPLTCYGMPVTHLQTLFIISALCRFLGLSLLLRVHEAEAVAARTVMREVGRANLPRTLWNLVRLQRSADAESRVHAARALGAAGSTLALDELVSALEDSDRDVRREAARSLGRLGDERAAPALIAKAEDPVADIAEEAISALGQIHSDAGLAELVKLLSNERAIVRRDAALALGALGEAEATAALEERLEVEPEAQVFLALTEALSKARGTRVLHSLRTVLDHAASEQSRRQVANSLGNILGPSGEFYRLLESPPLPQEERVARIVEHGRRLLLRWQAQSAADREYLATRLDAALDAFGRRDYGTAVVALHQVSSRAVRCFADSRQGLALLGEHPAWRADLPARQRVALLLDWDAELRLNLGLLGGLQRDSRRRRTAREQALLGVFACGQVVRALRRLGRARGALAPPVGVQ